MKALLKQVQWDAQGLIPAIIQDAKSRQVLTLCYMTHAALKKTLATGMIYLYRRSQQRLMAKGETSGHIQRVRELAIDCEGKSLLFLVDQHIAACHQGYFTCYFRCWKRGRLRTIGQRVFQPEQVYARQ